MNDILTISNVRGYLDKETSTAYLNAEDVARGFGFTTKQNINGVEYDNVRWNTVNKYLSEFGFFATSCKKVGKDDFLPENMVYRLGFKANNETAQRFQAKLADEILPAIRKHGGYLTPEKVEEVLMNPDTIIKLATELKNERAKREAAELEAANAKQIIGELKPMADYTDKILACKGTVPTTSIAKDYGMSAAAFNRLLHEQGIIYKMGKQWFLYAKYQAKGYTHSKTFGFKHKDGSPDFTVQTEWTQKGRLFLYEFLKSKGILPMIERADDEEAGH